MPDPISGVIAATTVVSGGLAKRASDKATKAAKQGADAATAESQRQFDIVREDTRPIRELGNAATDRISRLSGYAQSARTAPLSFEEWQSQRGGISSPNPGLIGRAMGNVQANQDYDRYVREFTVPAARPAGPDMSVFYESPDYQFNLGETQKAVDRMSAARGRYDSGATIKEGARYVSNLASREFASFYDRLLQTAGLGNTGIGQSAAAGSNAASMTGNAAINAGNQRANAYMTGAQGINSAVQSGVGNYALLDYLRNGSGSSVPRYATAYGGVPA